MAFGVPDTLLVGYLTSCLSGSPGELKDSLCDYMGSCQNYGPFLGTLNNRCRIIIGTQKGTILLTTTHIRF